ncbi:MAG TPA: hypothetical protein VGI99_06600 [Gemmataceae bacterium]
MAFSKSTSANIDDVRPYLHGVAKYLVDQLWGARGPAWGTPLADIEDVALAIRQVLTERMFQQALQRQADTPAPERPADFQRCPTCEGTTRAEDPDPRNMTTRGGEAVWQEPREFCRRCRRDFFPSDQEPRH